MGESVRILWIKLIDVGRATLNWVYLFNFFLIFTIKRWPKTTGESKTVLVLHVLTTVHHWGASRRELNQRKNMKAGTKAEAITNISYWLAPYGFPILLSYTTHGHLPKGGITHNVIWVIVIIHPENVSQTFLQANMLLAFYQLKFPLPRCQSDKTKQNKNTKNLISTVGSISQDWMEKRMLFSASWG